MSTQIDKALLAKLRPLLETALEPIAKELGIDLKLGGGTYMKDGSSGTLKLELASIAADGTVNSKAASDFKSLAAAYGMSPDDLGREFATVKGARYRITGLNVKARTSPILTVSLDNQKEYVWPVRMVKVFLSAEPQKA